MTDTDTQAQTGLATYHDPSHNAAALILDPGTMRSMTDSEWLPPIVAKLERPEAVQNLESIIKVTDGVMVARGDLGVEMSPAIVPAVQKSIIRTANLNGKFVITATQMLESMINNPRPTRAEAADVANAIFDGSDAVMLSAESASDCFGARDDGFDAGPVLAADADSDF